MSWNKDTLHKCLKHMQHSWSIPKYFKAPWPLHAHQWQSVLQCSFACAKFKLDRLNRFQARHFCKSQVLSRISLQLGDVTAHKADKSHQPQFVILSDCCPLSKVKKQEWNTNLILSYLIYTGYRMLKGYNLTFFMMMHGRDCHNVAIRSWLVRQLRKVVRKGLKSNQN